MRVETRQDRRGKVYFSFVFTGPVTNKKTRLKKEEAPRFKTPDEAELWAKSQDAHYEATKEAVLTATRTRQPRCRHNWPK